MSIFYLDYSTPIDIVAGMILFIMISMFVYHVIRPRLEKRGYVSFLKEWDETKIQAEEFYANLHHDDVLSSRVLQTLTTYTCVEKLFNKHGYRRNSLVLNHIVKEINKDGFDLDELNVEITKAGFTDGALKREYLLASERVLVLENIKAYIEEKEGSYAGW